MRTLRRDFLSREFLKVTSFLSDDTPTPLKLTSFRLNCWQQVKVSETARKGEPNYKWVEMPIGLEELFAERCVFVAKGPQSIRFALLTGGAGCGKSTLVRKLAYIWAKGECLQEVVIVYIILVRDLRNHYKIQGDCLQIDTLAKAVVC